MLFLVSSGAKSFHISNLFNNQLAYIVLLSLFLCAIGFIAGAIGFYRLSKITRHLSFFENFAFSFLAVGSDGVILDEELLKEDLKGMVEFSWRLGLSVFVETHKQDYTHLKDLGVLGVLEISPHSYNQKKIVFLD